MSAIVRVEDPAAFLASLEQAKAFLAACSDVDEVKLVRDKAEAVRVWARAQKDAGELEVAAGELRVRATVRMGELMPEKAEGGRGQKAFPEGTVSRKEAHVARAVASVPAPVRERVIAETKARGEAPTVAALLRAKKDEERRVAAEERRAPVGGRKALTVDDLAELAAAGRRFPTIYADPPWSYDDKGTRGTTENHYETMDLDAIRALPVGELAAPDSHLHLWATSPLLPEALSVIEAWGFRYVSSLVWLKSNRLGLGHYWRVSHELLLLGVRGSLEFCDHSVKSYFEAPGAAHSQKPEEARALVERVSPGPWLELFGRAAVPGWVVWGNQVPREAFEEATS